MSLAHQLFLIALNTSEMLHCFRESVFRCADVRTLSALVDVHVNEFVETTTRVLKANGYNEREKLRDVHEQDLHTYRESSMVARCL